MFLQYVRDLKNMDADLPYKHAVYYLAVLLSEQIWKRDDLLEATPCKQIR